MSDRYATRPGISPLTFPGRRDVSLAFRFVAKRPGFTAAVVVMMAVGIGVTTSFLSLADAVLLRPPAYPEPDRLLSLTSHLLPSEKYPSGYIGMRTSPENYFDVARMTDVFSATAAVRRREFSIRTPGGPLRVNAARVSALEGLGQDLVKQGSSILRGTLSSEVCMSREAQEDSDSKGAYRGWHEVLSLR